LLGGKKDGDVYQTRGFSSNIEAGIVIDYLKNNDGQRDPHKPFSMMWDPIPPHMPYDSVKDCEEDIYREYYKDLPPNQLLNRLNVDVEKAKDDIHLQTCARVYFSLVTSIDREVGRVLQALEQSGEAENTIVVFTSDHGEMMGSHGLYAKSQIYEEAYLIPFMIRFPKKLKPRMEYLMIGKVDVMPTLLGLMGLKDRIPHTVQGVDYSVGLVTESFIEHPNPRSSAYLMEDAKGVRTDRYSYRVGSDGSTQLFDNSVDPYQLKNLPLTAIDPADRRFLEEELGMWLKKASDPFYQSRMHRDLITYPA
jgi:arylsulfatase A-like enzyme